MWNRKEIKRRGKRQFLRNWWATVAVCFLLAFAGAESPTRWALSGSWT